MEESAGYINALLKAENAPFRCSVSSTKGRTLHLTRSTAMREILFRGTFLHIVHEDFKSSLYMKLDRLYQLDAGARLDYAAMWYWCGLNSLTKRIASGLTTITEEQSKQLRMLYHSEVIAPSYTMRRVAEAVQPFVDRVLTDEDLIEIETMTVIWTLNCFEHTESPLSYATFFLPSFISHSCSPSAVWTTVADRFEIRCQKEMRAGDELTVTYLTEEFGLRPIEKRRQYLLSTKFFTCDCVRCTAASDDTRGFRVSNTHFVRFPMWDLCACGCDTVLNLSGKQIENLLDCEHRLTTLVVQYDGGEEESVPSRTDPSLIGTCECADELGELAEALGPFHWGSARAWLQLAEWYRSKGDFPHAIDLTRKRIHAKRNFVKLCDPSVSASLAWALEELGDLLLMHVSGSVMVETSHRQHFCDAWVPRSPEDIETVLSVGLIEAYSESFEILAGVFGKEHEHTVPLARKLDRFSLLST